tara:strand:+ start:236 stop:490 length:255 start_codon:yes stop_codon:yes gene_type:complete
MKINPGRFFFPGRFYSYKGKFKISVISYRAGFVQKSTREDFLPYKHPLNLTLYMPSIDYQEKIVLYTKSGFEYFHFSAILQTDF